MADLKGESASMMRKSCVVPPSSKFPRSRSVCDRETAKISVSSLLQSPFKSSLGKEKQLAASEFTQLLLWWKKKEMASPNHESKYSKVEIPEKSSSLPGILSTLSKEAMQQRETAHKIALQALREATVTETVVRHLNLQSPYTEQWYFGASTKEREHIGFILHRGFDSKVKKMSNVTGASSGASTARDRGRVMGVPRRCWCGKQILARISKSENNPYRRYYRCAYAYAQKLKNDNHAWKWLDEALLDEIEALGFRAEILEYELKEISRARMELEKMVFEKMQMKLEKEIFERVEEVLDETKSNMKKMMVLVCFGCMFIVGCSKLIG